MEWKRQFSPRYVLIVLLLTHRSSALQPQRLQPEEVRGLGAKLLGPVGFNPVYIRVIQTPAENPLRHGGRVQFRCRYPMDGKR